MRILALISFISFVELKLLKSQFGSNLFHVKVHPPPEKDRSLRGQHRIENSVYDFSLLCGDGIPLLMEDHKPRPCQPRPWLPEQKCPTGFWCHEGQSDASFYCCPNSRKFANRCHLPPAVGYGKQRMRRFYFDWKTDACHELQYSGIGGNENSFQDYERCENVCRGAGEPPISLPSNMKIVKSSSSSTTTTTVPPSTTSYSTTVVPKETTTITEPEVFEFTVPKRSTVAKRKTTPIPETTTVPPTTVHPSTTTVPPTTTTTIEVVDPNPCAIPADQGTAGEMAMTMWYFDQAAATCSPFLYQGSGGNSNRFDNAQQCAEACGIGKPTRKSCELPPSIGTGKFNIPRYYFDTVTRKCEQFFYSGRDGNDNRFFKKTKCEKLCLRKKPKKKENVYEFSTPSTSLPIRIVQNLKASETSTPVSTTTTPMSTTTTTTTTTTTMPSTTSTELPETLFTDPYRFESTATPHPTLIFEPRGETLPTIGTPNNIVDDVFANLMNSRITDLVQTTTPTTTTTTTSTTPETPVIRFSSHERNTLSQPAPAPLPTFAPPPPSPAPHILHVTTTTTTSPTSKKSSPPPPPPLSFTLPSPITTIDTPFVTTPQPYWPETDAEPDAEEPDEIPASTIIQGSVKSAGGPQTLPEHEQLGQALGKAIGPQLVVVPQPHFVFPGFLPIQITHPPSNSFTLAPPSQPQNLVQPNTNTNNNDSPCALPMFGDATIMCENRPDVCPLGTFCQIGQGQSICCPILDAPPCDQEIEEGFGPSSIRRWSFDPATRLCQPFQFKGFKGNQNNFQSFDECHRACGATNICRVGVPKLSIHTHLLSCQSDADCPLAHNCLQSTPHNLCCQMTAAEDRGLVLAPIQFIAPLCTQPIDIGYGVMAEHRWSFQNGQCHSFLFAGNGGNMNNFLTRSDCLKNCQPTENLAAVDRCRQPASSGTGDAYLSRYFYSPEYHQCLHFIYSGSGGNLNNFESLADCLQTCVVKGLQFSSFGTTPPPPPPVQPHRFSYHFYPKKQICPKGDALMTIDGEPIQCDPSKAAKCPKDHVCTPVGNTAYCCPSPMNYCLQSRPPLSVCSGPDFKPAREIRFTYDPLADRCIRFSYEECLNRPPTSLNSFTSNSQCKSLCCNQGYNLVYKRRLLMAMNDSPIDDSAH